MVFVLRLLYLVENTELPQNTFICNNRYDMSKPREFYHEVGNKRTLQDIKSCAAKKQLSCEHAPLLDIPLDNVVLDELHLMLRVTGNNKNAQTCIIIHVHVHSCPF